MKRFWVACLLALLPATMLVGCGGIPKAHNLPPAVQLLEPGPGVGGPGPGVLAPSPPPMMLLAPPQAPTVQVLFARPDGMQVRWDVGTGGFDSEPLVVPGRQNFPQNAIYRLKITNIAGREGTELYPTVEIGPTTPRTEAFLAHNAIPVQFTEEDFDQVLAGNFVTKVIYLPDPEFQELALAGVETLVSTRLDPGVDPIVEADRRGSIMAVIRLGNKDLGVPGSGDAIGASFGGGGYGGYGGGYDGGFGAPCDNGGWGPCSSTGGSCRCGHHGAMGAPDGMLPPGLPPGNVAGVTAPQYGMTMSGTPIGLPGPPHIPLGVPAGLQKHSITNHTHQHIPHPDKNFAIHVKSQPGQSYPKPANHVFIREQSIHPALPYGQPAYDMHSKNVGGPITRGGGGYCPPGAASGSVSDCPPGQY